MRTELLDLRRPPRRGRWQATPRAEHWVPAPPREERPLWQIVALLYTAIACVAGLLIGLCFLVAYLVTGSAY